MKKTIIIVLIFTGLCIGAYFLFFDKEVEDFTYRYDKVSKGEITVVVTSTGTLSAVNTVQVGSQVSGTISKLYADFNSIVKEGQIIAQIDPTFLAQSVRDAEASLERATAQYNEAQRNFDRIKAMFDKKLESQANYDAAVTNLEMNKASLKQSQAQLERAKINLNYATIYAPVNGVVIDRKIDIGQTVAASFSAPTLFTIANDLAKMQVQATIDESDIGKISIGQEVTFTVDAYPDEKFHGTISQIRLAPVVVSNVVNYNVIIDVPNNDLKLMPGMTANVRVLIARKSSVLKVPNIALRFQPPTELIDTMKLKEMRESFRNRMSMNRDFGSRDSSESQGSQGPEKDQKRFSQISENQRQSKMPQSMSDKRPPIQAPGQNPPPDINNQNRFGGQERQGFMPFSSGDKEKFRKIRDSIQAAHGGNLSREEVMQEIQKVFNRQTRSAVVQKTPQNESNMISSSKGGYEIIQRYPQYQKSSTMTYEQTGMGRIWVMNSNGKLEPVFVRTGLNDGQYTEIFTESLNEGQQIVVGAFSNNTQNQQTGRNPLTGSQPGGPGPFMGGGRGR